MSTVARMLSEYARAIRYASSLISLLGILTVLNATPLFAQDIVVDWSNRKVVNSPNEIQKASAVKVQIVNANDVLFTYSVDVQVTTDSSDDFSLLTSLLNLPSASSQSKKALASGEVDACKSSYNDALTSASDIKSQLSAAGGPFNPEDQPGHFISIPLSITLQAWDGPLSKAAKNLQTKFDYLSANCTDKDEDYKTFVTETYPPIKLSLQTIQKKVDGKHTADGQAPASSGDVVSVHVTVSEKWKGSETVKDLSNANAPAAAFVTNLDFSSVLRLSAGFLFSQLQDRSYVTRTVPSASGTANVLGVNGDSRLTPYLVGLLNYQVPYAHWDKFGLWLSSGPTLRITSTGSNTSSFGFFGGVSAAFWNRLFITPGVHFGQFAGVPAGLSVGQTIPPNFGQLQPINRWTARFGFTITYKTLSLGALKNSSTKTTGKNPSTTTGSGTPGS